MSQKYLGLILFVFLTTGSLFFYQNCSPVQANSLAKIRATDATCIPPFIVTDCMMKPDSALVPEVKVAKAPVLKEAAPEQDQSIQTENDILNVDSPNVDRDICNQ